MYSRRSNQWCSICAVCWPASKHTFGNWPYVDPRTHHRASVQVSSLTRAIFRCSDGRFMLRDYRVNYLEFRLWIGIWVFVLLLIFVTFNLSFLVKYITRFTEDCFASLVALIFIYDAIREILKIRKIYPVNYRPNTLLDYSCSCLFTDIEANETTINDTNVVEYLFHGTNLNRTSQIACTRAGGFVIGSGCSTPVYHADIFFFSVLLFVFTFLICMGLKEFRQSTFFSSKVRDNQFGPSSTALRSSGSNPS
jgi:hypothetical protein